ncbi:MAG: right-handed parallel beta-helix repeat-containing protein, partial [Deltaproteobacteria bacterium]|nr:right-handed parallel beta-helix repeat-containing protein [Deltaproteobacteria bacterium]
MQRALLMYAVLALLPATARALDHVVSPFGADGGAGTLSSPWRTLGYAVSQASPGDRILLMDDGAPGTDDYKETVTVPPALGDLTIQRFDADGTPPRFRPDMANQPVLVIQAAGVTVSGLDLHGATEAAAIRFEETSAGGRVTGCRLPCPGCDGVKIGVELRGGAGHLVSGCEFPGNYTGIGVGLPPSLSLGAGHRIEANVFSGNAEGVRIGVAADLVVEGNSFQGCGASVWMENGNKTLIAQNVISGGQIQIWGTENHFSGNTVSVPENEAVLYLSGTWHAVEDNQLSGGAQGLVAISLSASVIRGNTFTGAQGQG